MEINEKNKKKEQQALIIRKYQQYLKLEKSLSPNTLDAYLTDLDKLPLRRGGHCVDYHNGSG